MEARRDPVDATSRPQPIAVGYEETTNQNAKMRTQFVVVEAMPWRGVHWQTAYFALAWHFGQLCQAQMLGPEFIVQPPPSSEETAARTAGDHEPSATTDRRDLAAEVLPDGWSAPVAGKRRRAPGPSVSPTTGAWFGLEQLAQGSGCQEEAFPAAVAKQTLEQADAKDVFFECEDDHGQPLALDVTASSCASSVAAPPTRPRTKKQKSSKAGPRTPRVASRPRFEPSLDQAMEAYARHGDEPAAAPPGSGKESLTTIESEDCATPAVTADHAGPSEGPSLPGAMVELHGLARAPHLNGCFGKVVRFNAGSHRYEIAVDGHRDAKLLQLHNLSIVTSWTGAQKQDVYEVARRMGAPARDVCEAPE
jgi:hypothetical protein